MNEISKEIWLGLFWFSVGFAIYTIILYGVYKSAGWRSTRRAFLWGGIGSFFFLGIVGKDNLAMLSGALVDSVFVIIGIIVIKVSRSARQPYEDRYKEYLEEKITKLAPTTEELERVKRDLRISDGYVKNHHDRVMKEWHRRKLEELDDPFEWRLLYGIHSEEQGGDVKAYEKRIKKGIIIGVVVFSVLVATVIIVRDVPPLVRYNSAIKLMNAGNTKEAIDKFTSLKRYKNADAYVYCCKAIEKAEAGDYVNANQDLHTARDIYRLPKEDFPEQLLELED